MGCALRPPPSISTWLLGTSDRAAARRDGCHRSSSQTTASRVRRGVAVMVNTVVSTITDTTGAPICPATRA